MQLRFVHCHSLAQQAELSWLVSQSVTALQQVQGHEGVQSAQTSKEVILQQLSSPGRTKALERALRMF